MFRDRRFFKMFARDAAPASQAGVRQSPPPWSADSATNANCGNAVFLDLRASHICGGRSKSTASAPHPRVEYLCSSPVTGDLRRLRTLPKNRLSL